jgi:oxalate decarboxylase
MANMFNFKKVDPKQFPSGMLFRASQANFPVLKGLAIQGLDLKGGAIREPHVHPNAHQMDYCVAGHAQVGIIEPGGATKLLDLAPGDISYVPQGYVHWIKNLDKTPLEFLVVLSHEEPETIEVSEILRGIPRDDMFKMYGIDDKTIGKLPNGSVIF